MRSDLFVYLSGPITAKNGYSVEDNTARAVNFYWQLLRAGIPAFCPHLSGAFPTAFTLDYELWIAYDFAVIDRCTHVLMLPRWEESSGALRDKYYAERKGKPVVYSMKDLPDPPVRTGEAT